MILANLIGLIPLLLAQAPAAPIAEPAASSIEGYGGWAGAGLLGVVLLWLFRVHLPAKDQLLMDHVKMASEDRERDRTERDRERKARDDEREKERAARMDEREKDRTTRHELAETFQKAIFEMHMQHVEDAKNDRIAFENRQGRLEDALKVQTAELKAAIAQNISCKFFASLPIVQSVNPNPNPTPNPESK